MLLLGCYRKVDCADPEMFATAAVTVLSRYPADVARKVTDPHSGLPATSKWVPSVAELREACEAINLAEKRKFEQAERIKAQFAERDRMAAMDPAEKRRAFIKQQMALINASFAGANPDRLAPPIDIRDMEECVDKSRLRRKLESELADLSRNAADSDLKLSPAALKAIGIEAEISA